MNIHRAEEIPYIKVAEAKVCSALSKNVKKTKMRKTRNKKIIKYRYKKIMIKNKIKTLKEDKQQSSKKV